MLSITFVYFIIVYYKSTEAWEKDPFEFDVSFMLPYCVFPTKLPMKSQEIHIIVKLRDSLAYFYFYSVLLQAQYNQLFPAANMQLYPFSAVQMHKKNERT